MNSVAGTEGRFRVLIVDDNEELAETLGLLLRLLGYAVRTEYSGREAVWAAEQFLPDCVISDLEMPGGSGYELAEQLRRRQEFANTRLVAHSALPDVDRAMAAGFDFCLVKPVLGSVFGDMLGEFQVMKKRLEQAEETTQQQSEVVGEVRELMKDVKSDLKEIKVGLQEDVKELKSELREVKQDVKEIREELSQSKEGNSGEAEDQNRD